MLDDKDEALLAALERNARASVVDLARRIGLSRSATQDRLARLERSGAIAGYTVRRGDVDGTEQLRAWLVVHYTAGTKCAELVPHLKRQDGVEAVFSLSGQPDALVEVAVANAGGLERLADRIRAIEGIERVSSHIVLSTHRQAARLSAG